MESTRAIRKQELPGELVGRQVAGGGYTFDELYRLAQVCHASGLFEDVADAAQAMIKIVKGQELGLPPTTAMSAFDLIKKRLFIKPWAIAAKINACGYGSYQVLEQNNERCAIAFMKKYPGRGWQDLPPVAYTYAEAKAHGLVDRSPHWKASPAHMLYQRAMGRGGAMYFPELLAGIEPPQDDTPVSPERHQENIVALFGAVVPEQAAPVRNVTPSPTPQPQQATRDSAAWDTLEAHRDDARLDPELLERIAAALSPLAPANESEAMALAQAVLDCLNDAVEDEPH